MRAFLRAVAGAVLLIWALPALADDTANEALIASTINSPAFQTRVQGRFMVAAVAVGTEVAQATTNGTTAAGNATLHFAATPAGIGGFTIADLTTPAAIGVGNTVLSTTATTAVMAAVAITPGVGGADVISFSPPSHAARQTFAGALYAGWVSPKLLAEAVCANATIQAEIIANAQRDGGNVLDADIDFQINSIYTGIATAYNWAVKP